MKQVILIFILLFQLFFAVNAQDTIVILDNPLQPVQIIENKTFLNGLVIIQQGNTKPEIRYNRFGKVGCSIGLNLSNTRRAHVHDNLIVGCDSGLYAKYCLNSSIHDNTFQENHVAICWDTLKNELGSCNMNNVYSNYIQNSVKCGIIDNNGVGNLYTQDVIEGTKYITEYSILLYSNKNQDKNNWVCQCYFEQKCLHASIGAIQKSDVVTTSQGCVFKASTPATYSSAGKFNVIK